MPACPYAVFPPPTPAGNPDAWERMLALNTLAPMRFARLFQNQLSCDNRLHRRRRVADQSKPWLQQCHHLHRHRLQQQDIQQQKWVMQLLQQVQ